MGVLGHRQRSFLVVLIVSLLLPGAGCQFDASLNGLDFGPPPEDTGQDSGPDEDTGPDRRDQGPDADADLPDVPLDRPDLVDVRDLIDVGPDADAVSFSCTVASDCPGADTECRVRTCIDRRCGVSMVPSGTVTPTQVAGDC